MKYFFSFALLLTLLAFGAMAQTPTTVQPAPARTITDVLVDPTNITFLTFLGANLADAKTDWHFSLAGRQYTLTPAQRLSVALGSSAVALYLREQFPSWKKPIAVGMGVLTAYFAGRALANTYSHGMPLAPATAPPIGPAARGNLAFAVQFRR